jgi:hypothetical protein
VLNRALTATLRNFWTLFVVAGIVVFPLQLLHAYVFRNVIATRAFHDVIETYPRYRQVHSVGRDQLDHASATGWAIVGLELALLPLGVRAARRVFEVEGSGGVPTAPDAWAAAVRRREGYAWARGWVVPAGVTAVAAVAVGLLLDRIGLFAADLLSDAWAWTTVGLGHAIALSTGAALALGSLAIARSAKATPPHEPTDRGMVRT